MQTAHEHTRDAVPSTPAASISRAFARAKREGRGALIPYFMCGYPSAAQCIELALAAAQARADIIELGVPFSDPLADGATIQHAGHVALAGGMTMHGCLEIARQVSASCDIPLILMGYYNPILAHGIEPLCRDAAASGVRGLIIPDLPPEEAAPLQSAAKRHGLSLIFLAPLPPPTSASPRSPALQPTAWAVSSTASLSAASQARAQRCPRTCAALSQESMAIRNSARPLSRWASDSRLPRTSPK